MKLPLDVLGPERQILFAITPWHVFSLQFDSPLCIVFVLEHTRVSAEITLQ